MSRLHLAVLLAAAGLLALPAAAAARTAALAPGGGVVLSAPLSEPDAPGAPRARGVARLGADLADDRGFGRNGYVLGRDQDYDSGRHAIAVAGDGSVLEAWTRAPSGAAPTSFLRRLLPDGRPDPALGPDGVRELAVPGFELRIADLVLRGEGAVVAGSLRAGSGRRELALLALDRDGRLDPGFGGGDGIVTAGRAGADASARALWRLPDGRLLAGGEGLVARFTPAGEPDTAFASGGRLALGASLVLPAPSGSGVFLARGAGTEGIVVERRDEDGTLDEAWSGDGIAREELDAGGSVSYAVTDAVPRPGGGVAVGAIRAAGADPCATPREAAPLLLGPDGALERELGRFEAADVSLLLAAEGGVLAHGTTPAPACGSARALARVRAYGADGGLAASRDVAPVLAPPVVTVAEGPSRAMGAVTGDAARFRFAIEPAGEDVVLECRLRDAPFAPCPADGVFPALAEGPAQLAVRAFGVNGANGPEVRWNWTVNHRAPTTTIAGAPAAFTRSRDARLSFLADEPATFICRVDQGEAQPCEGGIDLTGLADGFHQVTVLARDALGAFETAPKLVTWTVDTRPPVSFFLGGPDGESSATTATFPFGATEPGSTFECAVDGGPFSACASPLVVRDLRPGAHRVTVRAADALGNADPTGVTRTWTVRAPAARPPGGGEQPARRVRLLSIGQARGGRVRVRLRSPAAGTVRVRITVPGRRGARRVLAGTRRVKVRAGRAKTVQVRLNARGRRALRAAVRRGVKRPLRVNAALVRRAG